MRSWRVWVTFALQWNGIHPEKWHQLSLNQWEGPWLKSTFQRSQIAESLTLCTIIPPPSTVELRRKKSLICLNISAIGGGSERRRETADCFRSSSDSTNYVLKTLVSRRTFGNFNNHQSQSEKLACFWRWCSFHFHYPDCLCSFTLQLFITGSQTVISPGVPRLCSLLCVVVLICVSSFYVLLICVVSNDCSGWSLAVGSQLLLDLLKPAALVFCRIRSM